MLFHLSRSPYQVGGSLPPTASTYVEREADTLLRQALLEGTFCYVLNARQMGKSSLRVRTMALLQQMGIQSLAIDLTSIGNQHVTVEQWYAAIAGYLVKGFQLSIALRHWWQQHQYLPVVARLAHLIETVLLVEVKQPIVILIDEIDSILGLKFPTDDFFALIRTCLNRRAEEPDYRRLTFALFGVTTPSALISDKTRTPFEGGRAIALRGFTTAEAMTLATGLREWIVNADEVMQRIVYWTGGQPFLTQKLCQQVASEISRNHQGLVPVSDRWVDDMVNQHVLTHWEVQDEPEHLRTIRDRLWFQPHRVSQVLTLYQQVLKAQRVGQQPVLVDDSEGQRELLLIGLVEPQRGCLWVKNRIYQTIFSLPWVEQQLGQLRPYSQALNAWVNSRYQDESRLLRGQALKDTLVWAQRQSLSELDYRFLAASQAIDGQEAVAKVEAERLREVEARLAMERDRTVEQQLSLKRQRLLLGGVSLAMLMALGLGALAQHQSRRSARNEAQSVVRTAEALFASDQSFDALIEAIRGQRHLERLRPVDADIQAQADAILERIVLSIHQKNRLDGHTAAVMTADFSPDGKVLATAGVAGRIRLWRRDGTLLTTLAAHRATTRNVRFSRDGQWLISVGDDGRLRLWTAQGAPVRTIETGMQGLWGLAVSPDSQAIAVAGPTSQIEVWSLTGQLLDTIDTGEQPAGVRYLTYSPEGDRLAVGGNDGTVTLWSRNGQRLQTFSGHQEAVHSLAFSPDGELLISGSVDSTMKLWHRDGQLLKTIHHHDATVEGLAFSPDGQAFVSASHDKTLARWSRTGDLLETYEGHRAIVWDVAYGPDGQTFASVSADNTVLLWQAQSAFQQSFKGLSSTHFMKAAYSPDGQTLALAVTAKDLLLMSPQNFTYRFEDTGQGSVTNLAMHPTQAQVILAGENGTLQRWDLAGQRLQTFPPQGDVFLGVDWHPEGNEVISATGQGHLILWNAAGEKIRSWPGATTPIWDVVYSPDGELLATASSDGAAKLWSREGQLLQTLHHESAVWRLAFSPDGTLLATSSGDNTAKVWRVDGTLVSTLKGHHSAVWGIDFSPDGRLLATSSIDETVKLWTSAGQLLTTLKNHHSGVRSVVFRPDGQVLTSVGDDGSLVHWDLAKILPLEPLTFACDWIADYFKANPNVEERDRALCPPQE